MSTEQGQVLGTHLNEVLLSLGEERLPPGLSDQFGIYAALLMRWNTRTNLTAIRDEDGILRRHFAECIVCARTLPAGIGSLLDFGSGAGLPGIPIALCRSEIAVSLAESQGKKAAFLREAARTLGLRLEVHSGRAEALERQFDCVTLRAVDRMEKAVHAATSLVATGGWIALLVTEAEQEQMKTAWGGLFSWREAVKLPGDSRLLLLGQKRY